MKTVVYVVTVRFCSADGAGGYGPEQSFATVAATIPEAEALEKEFVKEFTVPGAPPVRVGIMGQPLTVVAE